MSGGKICKRNDRISQCCGDAPQCEGFDPILCRKITSTVNINSNAKIVDYCSTNGWRATVEIESINIPLLDIIVAKPEIDISSWHYGCRPVTIRLKETVYDDETPHNCQFIYSAVTQVEYFLSTTCYEGNIYVNQLYIEIRYFSHDLFDIEKVYSTVPDEEFPHNHAYGYWIPIFVFDVLDLSDDYLPNPYFNPNHPSGAETWPKITDPIPNLLKDEITYTDECEEEVTVQNLGFGGYCLVGESTFDNCLNDLCDDAVIRCQSCDDPSIVHHVKLSDRPGWAYSFRVGDVIFNFGGDVVDEVGQSVDEWFPDPCYRQLRKAYLCDNSAFITYDENDRPDVNHVTMFYNGDLYYITDEPSTDDPVDVEWSTGICPTGLYAEAIICDPSYIGSLAPEILQYKVNPNIGLGSGSVKLAIATSNPDCPTDVYARCFHNYYYQPTSNIVTPSPGLIGTHINGESCNMAGFITCIPCGNPVDRPRPSGIVRPESPEI